MEVVKETLQQKRTELLKIEQEKDNNFAKKVHDLLSTKTTRPISVVVERNSDTSSSWRGNEGAKKECRLSVGVLHEDNTEAFGCEYDLEVFDNHISINNGTMGSQTRKSNYEYVERAILIGETWKLENEIVQLFNETVDLSHKKEIIDLSIEISRIEEEEREKKDNAIRQEFKELLENNKIVVYLGSNNYDKISSAYEITHITNKLVKVKEIWIRRDYQTHKFSITKYNCIERTIKKNDMLGRFYWEKEKNAQYIKFLNSKEELENFIEQINNEVAKD